MDERSTATRPGEFVSGEIRSGFWAHTGFAVAVAAGLALFGLASDIAAPPAFAACDGGTPTDTCTGAISGGIVVGAPPVATLNVHSLTNDISQISLTGTAAGAGSGTGEFYTCSATGDPQQNFCTIVPHQDGPPRVPASCTAHGTAKCDEHAVTPPPPGSAGPPVTITYNQPTAIATISGSGTISTNNTGAVISATASTAAVIGASSGARGGNGGNAYVFGSGGNGGNGANGGTTTVNVTGAVVSSHTNSPGVVAYSAAGNGGDGGNAYSISGSGGDGGQGGAGGIVLLQVTGSGANPTTVQTFGNNSDALHAASLGGYGGSAGNCSSIFCGSSSGGNAAAGGSVTVTTDQNTSLVTWGQFSHGIYAASIGGFGGGGGSSGGLVAFGSGGGSAGPGGTVAVINAGSITTHNVGSYGIFAQAIGGGGGSAGSSGGLVALGASGARGGDGGSVADTN